MFLNITGGTKKERALVESLTVFSGYDLMTDATADKLEIDIELINNLYKTDGNLADVVYEDSNHRPKEFTIRVDKSYSLRRMLESIAHEMVHVAQFATGRWVELENTKITRFEGKEYKKLPNYWNRPWEIEAHGREVGLFLQWVEKEGLQKKPWAWDDMDKYKEAYE
mgnify:FL=1|tara:strand:+ start:2638 stop:3138 length:501 start_codon:yes stop_codon:yes gene_type:complete